MTEAVEALLAGRTVYIETGKIAGQANGAVTVRYGDTVVLVTACASHQPREGIDFFPLTVDYEERLYAAGKIPGGFIRREGRPTQEATLAARLIDRPLRPLFPKGIRHELQIIVTVLSVDQENDPDIMALIGASAALTISDLPFEGPVGAVRVGYINGQLVLNPTLTELVSSSLDLVVASTSKAVVMIEAGAQEVPEKIILEAIEFAHKENQELIKLQERLRVAVGKPKREFEVVERKDEVESAVSSIINNERLAQALSQKGNQQQEASLSQLGEEVLEKLEASFSQSEIESVFQSRVQAVLRARLLEEGQRPAGRGLTEVRPIECEVGLLPRTHGSGLFRRGQTQVLTITTLGSAGDEQKLDGLGLDEKKRFMHHYNFPPFSVGEVRRIGVTGRREIGHGALVERALLPVLPKETDFPYTIRLVSEVLSSSGSTSMASVCASILSLMDAGVPIKKTVAGISVGLVTGEEGRYVTLTDIEGMEDAYGDMDFKIAGTDEGITAIQMDTKLKGISFNVIERALYQGYEARRQILGKIRQVMATSRPQLSRYAPRMYRMQINPAKIGAVIGPGGKTIRGIMEENKVTIDVENDGTVLIGATNEDSAQRAMSRIESLTEEVQVGNQYTGKVSRLLKYGVLVEILPGKEGMVHISELADYRVSSVEDVVKVGDEIMVKVTEIDRLGRVNLSRRAVYDGPAQVSGAKERNSLGGRSAPMGPRRPHHTGRPD
jgi:polyribonucleotide nucleotidyltransferase